MDIKNNVQNLSNEKNKYLYTLMISVIMFLSLFLITGNKVHAGTDISNTSLSLKVSGNDITISASNTTTEDPVKKILDKLRDGLILFSSLATITFGFIFVINVTKLASSGDNPMARKSAITGLIISFVCFAFLGGITIIIGFFQNFFSKV